MLDLFEDMRVLRRTLRGQNAASLLESPRSLITTLPSKRRCEDLVCCYFRTLEPVYRVLHIPAFWSSFHKLWQDDPGPESLTDHFLMKLALVMAMGATFCAPESDEERDRLRLLAQRWTQSVQRWLTGTHEKLGLTFTGMQIFCLLILARHTTYNCPGMSAWLSESSLLRMAVSMGLHRDPSNFPSLSTFQGELRRRVWATVQNIYVQSALDTSLPLEMMDSDAALPSNINDADLDPTSKERPASRSGITDVTLQILLTKSLPIRLRIVRFLNEFRTELNFDQAIELGCKLKDSCREISAQFQTRILSNNSRLDGLSITLTEFHRKFLDVHLRRFVLHLHRPFMIKARHDARFYLARKACVEEAMVIISSTNNGMVPSESPDDFTRLALVGRGFFKCPFNFDTILVLALDIITDLECESNSPLEADILVQMARARRAPLISALERVLEHANKLVVQGGTSLQRYIFVAAHLSQIRAMEQGQSIQQAVYESVLKTSRKCRALLQEHCAARTPPVASRVDERDVSSPDWFAFGTPVNVSKHE